MNHGDKITQSASEAITERLIWNTACREQKAITKELADGKDIPEVYGLGEAGLFDEFFYFLDELGITKCFPVLNPKNKKRASNVNFESTLLIYIMRIVSGLQFFWHIESVILKSQSLMHLVGFNGTAIRKGTSKRGLNKGKKEQNDLKSDDHESIRGPICPDSIASNIESITAKALETLFNGAISLLASHSFFPKKIHVVMDASEIQSTEKCKGCGKVSKEKPPELRLRKGRIKKMRVVVFGFKIWVAWDTNSKLPLAMRFDTINVADINLAQELIEQAIKNMGKHATIATVAFDRGFLDGKFMNWLDSVNIIFYVPAKSNLNVYGDAIALVDSDIKQRREDKRFTGYGKNKKARIDVYEAVGIEGLTSAGFYGERGSGSHENSKAFVAKPINAVVMLESLFKKNNPNANTFVILTNGSVKKPLTVYDGYDARSEIENGVFREGKQSWFIERPAKNSAEGFRSHAYLTVLIAALTCAFRTWMDAQDKKERQGKETGISKFRERVATENANKLIVFNGNKYAIFEAYEVMILTGTNVLRPRGIVETITKDDILRKYNVMQV